MSCKNIAAGNCHLSCNSLPLFGPIAIILGYYDTNKIANDYLTGIVSNITYTFHIAKMKSPPQQQYYFPMWCSLILYTIMGVLHEISHSIAAGYLFGFQSLFSEQEDATLWVLFLRAALGRQFHLTTDLPAASFNANSKDTTLDFESQVFLVRHTGWIFSVVLALSLHYAFLSTASRKKQDDQDAQRPLQLLKMMVSTAYITALEAVVTDLCHFTPITSLQGPTTTTFFCGNFGAILLNACWGDNNFDAALTMLQHMTRITMIRGAQSGGLVTFVEEASKTSSSKEYRAIRSRVVNRKRTDLSEKLFTKVRQSMRWSVPPPTSSAATAKLFMGHTRFATTSIADFGGTHPHQFTLRTNRKIYDMQTGTSCMKGVVNYITHNGT